MYKRGRKDPLSESERVTCFCLFSPPRLYFLLEMYHDIIQYLRSSSTTSYCSTSSYSVIVLWIIIHLGGYP